MTGKGASRQAPHERRRGEAALSDFAEFVDKQQAMRYPRAKPTATAQPATEYHEELDILDTLNFNDSEPQVPLLDLLLPPADRDEESRAKLAEHVAERLAEGHGEAMFDLGFENNGDSMRLTPAKWDVALERLTEAAKKHRADCNILLTKNVGGDKEAESTATANGSKDKDCTGKILIRQAPTTVENVIETRIAVVGNVDAGKSSMLGVLVKGDLDDGRGKARVNLFRHKHEIETGRTSSVGMEIMGFDTLGNVITSETPGRKLSWEEIGKRSAKVITFTDLAGHERYLRTTVFGLLSSSPNYCLLMVAANNGLIGMSKEHLGIALALNVPIMVVVTKIDICPPNILEQTIQQITKILKSPGAKKMPIFINNREECINTATQFVSQRICPIFQVSNVTGKNLDLVRTFLNILPHHGRYDSEAPFEFHINDTFSVPFVGTVVSGIIKSGVVHVGDNVLVGPDGLGQFMQTSIRSIERKRIGVPAASAGQSASFALKKIRRKDVRKAFRFVQRPEYLAPGDRLLFREGRTKGLGIVKSVGYDPKHPLMPRAADDTSNGPEDSKPPAGQDLQAPPGVKVGA
ncbi:hypothetical protein ONZ43_g3663 [Nemania bipapillata]|uniref:Uncharacterized protein n=1 Tax=Nemania bipapillata TaxID=110536 RepID=A0ACC2IW17_9PEZI|nr:hypothetical protein ONZ43_g3663 [Nemania bipapillata]